MHRFHLAHLSGLDIPPPLCMAYSKGSAWQTVAFIPVLLCRPANLVQLHLPALDPLNPPPDHHLFLQPGQTPLSRHSARKKACVPCDDMSKYCTVACGIAAENCVSQLGFDRRCGNNTREHILEEVPLMLSWLCHALPKEAADHKTGRNSVR